VTLLDFLYLGEMEIKGSAVSFFGDAYVFFNTQDEWLLKEFSGVLTQDEVKYRGRWTQGPQFEELKRLFLADPRLVEVAKECVRRRLNIHKEKPHA
jgi:hypothetical protein